MHGIIPPQLASGGCLSETCCLALAVDTSTAWSPHDFRKTTTIKTMSAHSDIFSIVEILQAVLSELPPLDIIRCQRVSSTWKTVITDSPLLQYKAWLRNDCPDPSYRIRADDLLPESDYPTKQAYDTKRYNYNVSKHLHPIVVARIMEHPPDDPRFEFDPLQNMQEDGFGGYLNFRPVLLRDLMRWYERHKATEHIWGSMSLYRPDARKVCWELPDSEVASIPVNFEAVSVTAEVYSCLYTGYRWEVNKAPGQALVLTVGDLMKKLDYAWNEWLDSEREVHYRSHDCDSCDFDKGIPGEGCLDRDDDKKSSPRPTFGEKMTMEEYIERAMTEASS
jgi:hypothetical protein